MTRVLITGANGHIGANTVREALDRGYEVVAMVRETSDRRALEGLNVATAYGDIRDKDAVRKAAEGCSAIIHLAVPYTISRQDEDAIMNPAMVGARHVFEVGREVGISRMVYTSSIGAIGARRDPDRVLTAADWSESGGSSEYTRAKYASERAAWELAEQFDIPTIVLCPTLVLGRYDYRLTPTTWLFKNLIEGGQPAYPGSLDVVDVRDVAYTHVAALEKGAPGQRYIVGGESRTVREWGDIVAQVTGIKPGYIGGPRFAALALGSLDEFLSRLSNRRPIFTRGGSAEFYKRYLRVDCAAACDDFGYTPRSGLTAIRAMVDWLLSIDAFRPGTAEKIRRHQAQTASS